MDIIAFYLPQFYAFPENDKWWGKGFTEWTNVRKSKPLFKNHYQPTIPLNKNYYCLEDISVMKWQVELAKEYGVTGFCFYHYWFGKSRVLMEKPIENYRSHSEIDFPYCLCWANHNWSRTWVGGDKDILMDMYYGSEEEWEKHFNYLMTFFKDSRYIKIDDKPVLVIYQPHSIDCFKEMIDYFQVRAKEEGLKGITVVSQLMFEKVSSDVEDRVDYKIRYEPNHSLHRVYNNLFETAKHSPALFLNICNYRFRGLIKKITNGKICNCRYYNYNLFWEYILRLPINDKKCIVGGFVNFDATPRRHDRALIFRGATPERFGGYMKRLVEKTRRFSNKQIIFLSAWNEWGEGMYLEPDEKNQYGFLEGVKEAQCEFENM